MTQFDMHLYNEGSVDIDVVADVDETTFIDDSGDFAAQDIMEVLEDLKNDDGEIPEHAWAMITWEMVKNTINSMVAEHKEF